ncbi:DUF4139 domain-containing protein [Dokdonella koreensis]|uniref:DUF4139 domain-containing protein n=1 Tax=Dokdonella koreensis DS-123 TaxID=1300342 RepID=A0A160DV11_9GAMM|nr:DUF4139 domain-containing protein [Dokdonella koreensis]ANB18329.1 Hypothetical protein I596_2319 [Dokdonella koreensis DS-123]
MHRTLLATGLTLAAVVPAAAADSVGLTIYRNSGGALFEGGGSPVADGYAVVHERRSISLSGGRESLSLGGLPTTLDPEAVALDLGRSRVLAQRVLSAGDGGTLAAHRGERVQIQRADGSAIVTGVLVGVDGNGLTVRDDSGDMRYLREYAAVRFLDRTGQPGSTLQLVVDGSAGNTLAALTYPTSGLGWRAAYAATLADGSGCSLNLEALASIANRSGRDYQGARLKLIAGEPNIASGGGPQPFAMKAMMARDSAPESLPEQAALGDYRSYVIDGALDLPDASVTQVPLYAPRTLNCQRSWLFDVGNAWFPAKPLLTADYEGAPVASRVVSSLRFVADENLPAGTLRVLTRDRDGSLELLAEARLDDTAKGLPATITLGNAFDLSGQRERTAFSVDRGGRTMDEGFRVTLTNSGDVARTVTVRAYPNRWRTWSLVSSSQKPARQTVNQLEFAVEVPKGGKATLDYALRYSWTPTEE